jgi:hypothetical protein
MMANDVLATYSLMQLYQLQTDVQHEIDRRLKPPIRVRLLHVDTINLYFSTMDMRYFFEEEGTGRQLIYYKPINQSLEVGQWYLIDGDIGRRQINHVRQIVKDQIKSISPFSSSSIIARSNNFTVDMAGST